MIELVYCILVDYITVSCLKVKPLDKKSFRLTAFWLCKKALKLLKKSAIVNNFGEVKDTY